MLKLSNARLTPQYLSRLYLYVIKSFLMLLIIPVAISVLHEGEYTYDIKISNVQ